jgi:cystathionine beta-synthase
LNNDPLAGTVADLLARREPGEIYTAKSTDTVRDVISLLKRHGISQVPVLDGGTVAGIVNERDLLDHLLSGKDADGPIEDCIETRFAIVELRNNVGLLSDFFSKDLTVLVLDAGKLIGVITKIDFIDFVSRAIRG